MVDDPDFAVYLRAEHYLIQFGIVGHRVEVDEIIARRIGNEGVQPIDVEQFGMFGHHSVVILGRVEVLHQVIP